MRWKKVILVVFGIIAVVLACWWVYMYNREQIAISAAKEYLDERFYQEMRFLSSGRNFINVHLYHVRFSPVDNPELIFEVIVGGNDLMVRPARPAPDGSLFVPDSYYLEYFALKMRDHFKNDILKVWDNEAVLSVSARQTPVVSFKAPVDFDSLQPIEDTLEEMLSVVDLYIFFIEVDTRLSDLSDEDIKLREANRIFDFIQIVRESGFEPTGIVIRFAPRSANNARRSISFGSPFQEGWLQEITTVEQVLEELETLIR